MSEASGPVAAEQKIAHRAAAPDHCDGRRCPRGRARPAAQMRHHAPRARHGRPSAAAAAPGRVRGPRPHHRRPAALGRQRGRDLDPHGRSLQPVRTRRSARVSTRQLAAAGLSRAKIRTLRAIADACSNGLDLAGLDGASEEQVHAALTEVVGIGPWTADVYIMFCLGRADGWAPGDLALQIAAQRAMGLDERPSADDAQGDRRALAALARRGGAAAVGLLRGAQTEGLGGAGLDATSSTDHASSLAAQRPHRWWCCCTAMAPTATT